MRVLSFAVIAAILILKINVDEGNACLKCLVDKLELKLCLLGKVVLDIDKRCPGENQPQQVYQPAQQFYQPAQPVYQPVQPVYQPVQPVYQPAQPVYQPAQQVYQPAQQVYQPPQGGGCMKNGRRGYCIDYYECLDQNDYDGHIITARMAGCDKYNEVCCLN